MLCRRMAEIQLFPVQIRKMHIAPVPDRIAVPVLETGDIHLIQRIQQTGAGGKHLAHPSDQRVQIPARFVQHLAPARRAMRRHNLARAQRRQFRQSIPPAGLVRVVQVGQIAGRSQFAGVPTKQRS